MGIRVMTRRTVEDLPVRPSVFTESLPADSYTASVTDYSETSEHLLRTSRPVYNAIFSFVPPEKAPDPKLLAASPSALKAIELDPEEIHTDEFLQVFSGNRVLEGTRPWALCYGGHQFGIFAGQLGDGRVISLFETHSGYEVQLKGAGRTPYSRFGDGYAVLRSSIREFLVSEHMHALGVPTTRALALVATSRQVFRDDAPANVRQPERGAIVTRLAPSWLRFGNFEILYARGDMDRVRQLADYAFEKVVTEEDQGETGNRYARLFRRIARRTAKMVAEWQAIGFNHGVMNTDNMSILGLTLDYGPFQFLDYYNPANICNHSDDTGQYAFKRQPTVCIFNMFKLAVPLFELMGAGDEVDRLVFPSSSKEGEDRPNVTDEATREAYREEGKEFATKLLSQEFTDWFMEHLLYKMRKKLGLQAKVAEDDSDMNDVVIPLLDWLTAYQVDYHRFFRSLANYEVTEAGEEADAIAAVIDVVPRDRNVAGEATTALKPWLAIYRHRLLAEGAIDNAERRKRMNAVNPRFVLRNWIAQEVVDAFENVEEDEARKVLESCLFACTEPYREKYEDERIERWVNEPVPEWACDLKCSCSS